MSEEGLDDALELDGDLGGGSGSDNSAPPTKDATPKGDDKRVSDLMGKWQAEQAKNAKLTSELAALQAAGNASPKDASADGGTAAKAAEFIEFARENARKQLFDGDARLSEYGLNKDAIAGSTLDEMKASFRAQIALIDGIESRARNKVLVEHGLDADVATGEGSEKPLNIAAMSDEEFAKKFLH
mgnify:CR=1 FL=1